MTKSRRNGWAAWLGLVFALWAFVFASSALAGPADKGMPENSDPYRVGVKAFNEGDYETALRAFRLLAATNDFRALTHLGMMHEKGLGLKADLAQAAKLYRRAAESATRAYHHERKQGERQRHMAQSKDGIIHALRQRVRNLQDILEKIRRQLRPGYGPPVPNKPQ
jgi:TPR repeat protein